MPSSTMADIADRHLLYEKSVQSPEEDANFLISYFTNYMGRELRVFREDFCGTAALACHIVKSHRDIRVIGVDYHGPTLAWGMKHNVSQLTTNQQRRIQLLEADVLDIQTPKADLIAALNFSYQGFRDRPSLLGYMANAKASLKPEGLLIMDLWGGSESQVLQEEEEREIENSNNDGIGNFSYIWDQEAFDPATYHCTTRIHFSFRDGSEMRNAFTYEWRLWTLPEVMELMQEAGFHDIHFLWEGTDPKTGEGNGIYTPAKHGEADLAWIAYAVGQKPKKNSP